MNEPDKNSNLPTILVVILALFGLTRLPQGTGKRSGEEPQAQADVSKEDSRSEPNEADGDDLGPLTTLKDHREHFVPHVPHSEAKNRTDKECLLRSTKDLQFLIVTVPDPDGTSMSHEFDPILSAVLQATESAGYIAVRHWFPWDPPPRGPKPTRLAGKLGAQSVDVTVGGSAELKDKDTAPGGVLCRRSKASSKDYDDLLLLLLVPESPTRGVDVARFGWAVDLVRRYQRAHGRSDPRIRIVSPVFSGSIPSLTRALKVAMRDSNGATPQFLIYNGAAVNPDLEVLFAAFPCGDVKFRSTVHHLWTLVKTAREFILDTSMTRASPVRYAVLLEANTPLGQGPTNLSKPSPWEDRRFQLDLYKFPMKISRIREEYTARGYYRSNEPVELATPERLSLQGMAGREGDTDLMPIFTPAPTAVGGEMLLSQTLDELARRNYDWIGITSTNIHDRLFLAYKVRQVCPDARLFFTTGDALYSHHGIVAYLRGALVVSTYPQRLANQAWTSGAGLPMSPRVAFASDDAEGIYNATAAHLSELDPERPATFLDYQMPGQEGSSYTVPPVWISAVGERGLYPLAVRNYGTDEPAAPSPSPEIGRLLEKELPTHHAPAASGTERTGRGPAKSVRIALEAGPVVGLIGLGIVGAVGGLWSVPARRAETGSRRRRRVLALRWLRDRAAHPVCLRRAVLGAVAGLAVAGLVELVVWCGLGPEEVKDLLMPRLHATWIVVFLAAGSAGLMGAGGYVWACGAARPLWAYVAGDTSPSRAGWLRVPLRVRNRVDHPSGRRLAAVAALAWLVFLVLLGTPAWGAAIVRWPDSGLDRTGRLVLTAGGFAWTTGLVAFVIAWVRLLDMPGNHWLRRRGTRVFWAQAIAFASLALVLSLGLVAWLFLLSEADLRLYCERASRLIDGVSPLVPLILLAVAGGIGIVTSGGQVGLHVRLGRVRRPPVPAADQPHVDAVARREFHQVFDDVRRLHGLADRSPRAVRREFLVVPVVMALLGIDYWIAGLPGSLERWPFHLTILALFTWALVLIVRQLVELAALWWTTSCLLRHAARLPMVRAFDRLPARLAQPAWAVVRTQKVNPDGSDPLIDRQFQGLLEGYDRVKRSLAALAGPNAAGLEPFDDLSKKYRSSTRPARFDSGAWWETVAALAALLGPYWARRSAVTAFATSTGPGAMTPTDDDEWPGASTQRKRSQRRGLARAASVAGGRTDNDEVRRWLGHAEEFIALVLARYVSWFRHAGSSVTASLVVGLVALVLVLTSYPFQPEGLLLSALALLTTVTIIAVVAIALQANRDEIISRIDKSVPNRFTLDRELVTTLVTYVVPLAGLLFALSYDMSDLIRSWFEPLFR
ncbi:MAG: hypothetical protein P4L84_05450 [Isosphaeraceae bacterium]|nr:hypothetical protein [Isosphaeraceae bacterium]